jgi:hypothetical protein
LFVINILPKWHEDPRRDRLVQTIGSLYADGMAVAAWKLAFRALQDGQELVPEHVFRILQFAQEFIDAGLARLKEGGVYVCGCTDIWKEYLENVAKKKGAGKNSAEVRKKKYGTALPPNARNRQKKENKSADQLPNTCSNATEHSPNTCSNATEPLVLVLKANTKNNSLTGVICADTAQPEQKQLALPEKPPPETQLLVPKQSKFSDETRRKMRAFIGTYAKGFQEKYHGPPESIRDKALIGRIGHWIEHVPEVRAIQLVEVYLQVDYRPINESLHDLWQFFRHLNRIGIALDTKASGGTVNWAQVFQGA